MLIVFTLPMVLYLFVFNYLPMFGAIIAFKQYRFDLGILGSPWVGFANFRFFFTSPDLWRLVRNTLGYNFAFMILGTVVPIVLAFMLFRINSRAPLRVYQTAMFLPYYLSWVSVAFIGYVFLSFNMGVLNQLLRALGQQSVNFYASPGTWVLILPLVNLWKGMGVSVIIYYSVLLGIDPSYREAALIEGASGLQVTRRIYLPFLYPMITILNILAVGQIFNSDFGLFYQFTMDNSALYPATDVMETYIFRALQKLGNYGMSSAAGLLKSFLGFVLVIAANAVVRRVNEEMALY